MKLRQYLNEKKFDINYIKKVSRNYMKSQDVISSDKEISEIFNAVYDAMSKTKLLKGKFDYTDLEDFIFDYLEENELMFPENKVYDVLDVIFKRYR